MLELTYRYCTTCATEQAFEVPECMDRHGADCPELVCVECGVALLVEWAAFDSIEDTAGSTSAETEGVSSAA
jgi:hypothetical protein